MPMWSSQRTFQLEPLQSTNLQMAMQQRHLPLQCGEGLAASCCRKSAVAGHRDTISSGACWVQLACMGQAAGHRAPCPSSQQPYTAQLCVPICSILLSKCRQVCGFILLGLLAELQPYHISTGVATVKWHDGQACPLHVLCATVHVCLTTIAACLKFFWLLLFCQPINIAVVTLGVVHCNKWGKRRMWP